MTPPHGFLFNFLLVYITYMVVAFTIVDFKNRVRSMVRRFPSLAPLPDLSGGV